jgi:signal transduction histidine kinase
VRRRLALFVTAAMALVLVAFVVPLAVLVRSAVANRAMSAATSQAQSLSALVATADPAALRLSVDELNATAAHPVTVFLPDGSTIGAPAERGPAVRLAAQGNSITVAVPGGREILVAVEGAAGGTAVVRTFVGDAELSRGVAQAWLVLALLGLALLAIGVTVADRLAASVVRPIGELAKVSHRLADGDLDARAAPTGPPEVREVAAGLNQLAGRIRELIWQEREAVADLSHRLRTPLTALRLEADGIGDPTGRDRISEQIQVLDDAVTALIEDSRRRGTGPSRCDAVAVVAARVAFWSVLAEDQQRELRVGSVPGPVAVAAGPTELAACLDALLGNVFAHTPEGTACAVDLAVRPGGGAILTVSDNGPGFTGTDPVRRGASGAGSTGLGLDIARQTAEASGGALTVHSGPGGATVVVELGPPRRP